MDVYLDTPIQYLKGVGPHFASIFADRGVKTVGDLLEWYPRAYEDRRVARNIASVRPGEIVSLKARVIRVQSIQMGRSSRRLYDVTVGDESGRIHCKFFRVPYKGYFDRFTPNMMVRVVGKVLHYRGSIEFHHPDILAWTEEADVADELVPLYTETEGLSHQRLQKIIRTAIEKIGSRIPDLLPSWICEKYNLPSRPQALAAIHIPPKNSGPEFGQLKSIFHRRIIFEEFFWLELFLAIRHAGLQREKARALLPNFQPVEKAKESLSFSLTEAQEKALREILGDLVQPHPMHRLVQGDVGSGKTIVALLSAIFVVDQGHQAAIMVPTEILAEQHLANASRLLEPLGYKVGSLTGHQTAKEKREVLARLKSGEIQVIVGTHALIEDQVEFKDLALVIVDEQHRFGVHQRQFLKSKGMNPHFLVMTATPIPRTLAMTVYGDLDISVIDQMPKGRIPITTRVVFEKQRGQVLGFMADQIKRGRQAYIIFPLVEESEKIDLQDAISSYERLQVEMPQIRFGLLHGRMKAEEKEQVMEQFRKNELQVLVSTTVIEVGVDVPNANLMIIHHSERFGLSQLHQLRGRVGRGEFKSYCVLMLGYAVSDDARARTEILARSSNGFEIAEADLEIRGPGEFLGTRQSGLPGFKMANIVRDAHVLQEAREAAFEVIEKDPKLLLESNKSLRTELERSRGPVALATVG